jgi:hypothetical protein
MFQLRFVQHPLHDSTIMNVLSNGAMGLQLMSAFLCHAAHKDMCQKQSQNEKRDTNIKKQYRTRVPRIEVAPADYFANVHKGSTE